jgi:FAD synthase
MQSVGQNTTGLPVGIYAARVKYLRERTYFPIFPINYPGSAPMGIIPVLTVSVSIIEVAIIMDAGYLYLGVVFV